MHEHWKAERTLTTRLLTSLCLNAAIALAEIIAGVFSGSVALIADWRFHSSPALSVRVRRAFAIPTV
jgi:Co/Zn/Cd efflux system component